MLNIIKKVYDLTAQMSSSANENFMKGDYDEGKPSKKKSVKVGILSQLGGEVTLIF